MDIGAWISSAVELLVHVGWAVVALALVVCVEFARHLWRRRRWMAEHGELVGTVAVVMRNDDGRTVLDNGLEVPAQGARGAWRYRHEVGETVEVLGYPSFFSLMAEPPLTVQTHR